MTRQDEPLRLGSDGSTSSSSLKLAITEAQADLPSKAHVEEMLARFPIPMPPPGDGGGGALGGGGGTGSTGVGPTGDGSPIGGEGLAGSGVLGALGAGSKSATTFGAAKIGAIVLAGALGVGAIVAGAKTAPAPTPSPRITSAATATAATTSAAPEARAMLGPAGQASAEPTAGAAPSSTGGNHAALHAIPSSGSITGKPPASTDRAPAPSLSNAAITTASAEPRTDTGLLNEAMANLRSNPARALALVDEHASTFPKSGMAMEREMIRVQALVASGQRARAQAIADAFKKAHPGSPYARRLDQILK